MAFQHPNCNISALCLTYQGRNMQPQQLGKLNSDFHLDIHCIIHF